MSSLCLSASAHAAKRATLKSGILPPQWANTHPFDELKVILAALSHFERPVLIVGDINARVRLLRAALHHPLRLSDDLKDTDTRGRDLIATLKELDFAILNGTLGTASAKYTSHQAMGESVIDLVMANSYAVPAVTSIAIAPHERKWSDHSRVVVTIRVPHSRAPVPQMSRKLAPPPPPLPTATELDRLLIATLDQRVEPEALLTRLFGYATVQTDPVLVYTDGSCRNNGRPDASAGSGVYWGENNALNAAERTPGPGQTNNRGELYAVAVALRAALPDKTLRIISDSEYAITACTWNAPKSAACEWNVPNGDLVKMTTWLIQRRPAPVRFSYTKGHANSAGNNAADALANQGAGRPPVPELALPHNLQFLHPFSVCADGVPRVSVDIPPPTATAPPVPVSRSQTRQHEPLSDDPVADKKRQNLDMLLDAAPFAGRFWSTYRGLNDPARGANESPLPAQDIMPAFRERMNPIVPAPQSIDNTLRALNALRAYVIPGPLCTVDSTPEQFFDGPVTATDIQEIRAHHKTHTSGETPGLDSLLLDSDIAGLYDKAVATLANACFERRDCPTAWLVTVAYAAVKRGKNPRNAADLRTIGAESKFLKDMTLLAHFRITRWLEARDILPQSQNGFRKGYRTINNVFILRCLIDKARAMGRRLYVATVDITNAYRARPHWPSGAWRAASSACHISSFGGYTSLSSSPRSPMARPSGTRPCGSTRRAQDASARWDSRPDWHAFNGSRRVWCRAPSRPPRLMRSITTPTSCRWTCA